MREAVRLLYSVKLSGTRCEESAAWDILIRQAMSTAYTKIQDQQNGDRWRKSSTAAGLRQQLTQIQRAQSQSHLHRWLLRPRGLVHLIIEH